MLCIHECVITANQECPDLPVLRIFPYFHRTSEGAASPVRPPNFEATILNVYERLFLTKIGLIISPEISLQEVRRWYVRPLRSSLYLSCWLRWD